jgi:protein-S-isoprenylcysteine O-methyltransferase Ste14
MNTELIFRTALAVLLIAYASVRLYYARLAMLADKNFIRTRRDIRQIVFGILFIFSLVLMIIYIVAPQLLVSVALPIPVGWRWFGVGLGIMSIVLLLWAHRSLGKNLSAPGVIKEKQSLVTAGPYQWVRHPMYTVIFLLGAAYFLVSANWVIGLFWIGWIVGTVASMLRDEETALIKKFGDEYHLYMRRTHRFVPFVF